MPSRKIPFVNGQFYHVVNRGVAQMRIFNNTMDYKRYIDTFLYYQKEGLKPRFSFSSLIHTSLSSNDKIVEILCYCLMPNHFHFLLQQTKEGGITEFVSKLSNSYTKYFNTKNKRIGPILQGEFKAVHLETNEQLIHLSRYIHLNPLVSYVTKNLETYSWSSYPEYLGPTQINICAKGVILNQFESPEAYKQFVQDQEDYGKQLEMIKHQLLDYPQV
jgi:putative transposase